jgi:hypothetical protein
LSARFQNRPTSPSAGFFAPRLGGNPVRRQVAVRFEPVGRVSSGALIPVRPPPNRAVAKQVPAAFVNRMVAVLLFAPLFLFFEVGQLLLGERYLGVKQIARNADPRALGLSETTAFFWSIGILSYWAWMLALLAAPLGRVHALSLLFVAFSGFFLRRSCGLKWVLVILTFEGAIRMGLLFSLTVMAWQRI